MCIYKLLDKLQVKRQGKYIAIIGRGREMTSFLSVSARTLVPQHEMCHPLVWNNSAYVIISSAPKLERTKTTSSMSAEWRESMGSPLTGYESSNEKLSVKVRKCCSCCCGCCCCCCGGGRGDCWGGVALFVVGLLPMLIPSNWRTSARSSLVCVDVTAGCCTPACCISASNSCESPKLLSYSLLLLI